MAKPFRLEPTRVSMSGRVGSAAGMGLVVTIVILIGMPPSAAVEDFGDEVLGYYLAGGTFGGVRYVCNPDFPAVPEEWKVDLGAACDLRCPGNTCDITVWDDVWGNAVAFRVCFDGEEFCRPGVHLGSTSVVGARVTVAPVLRSRGDPSRSVHTPGTSRFR